MHQLSKIALVGTLASAMYGCQSDNVKSSAATPSVPQIVQPVAKPFNKPPMLSPTSSFIRTTDGTQRAKQVQKGRQDPFAAVFVQPVPTVVTNVVPKRVYQPAAPRITLKAPTLRIAKVRLIAPNPRVNIDTPRIQPVPLPPAAPIPEAVLPLPPQEPNLAKAIGVSGVIQVGEESEAIVKVPNEATSRYVKVGQRLANGQVLVKRIEMSEGVAPVVVLEQFGVEVARSVGEQPVNPTPTPPAGSTPTPTPTPAENISAPTPTPEDGIPIPPPPPQPTNSSSSEDV